MSRLPGLLSKSVVALALSTGACAGHARERVLYSFAGPTQDGSFPVAGLLRDRNGNLYGTTSSGGTAGDGIVFELAPDGTETVLHNFRGISFDDGADPEAALVADDKGNLYGTTRTDGIDGTSGIVFRITPDGTETVFHNFTGHGDGIDGAAPLAGMVIDRRGNLYGTTSEGGSGNCPGGCGTVFKIKPDGTETILHTFDSFGGGDGGDPEAGLILDRHGNLYGTTVAGGTNSDGTVFKIAPDGTETVLHNFTGFSSGSSDGGVPHGALIMDKAGNLYGTTRNGGSGGEGTVFKLEPDGTETVLHSFGSGNDGREPFSTLIADDAGDLFGTTAFGGRDDSGTVFELAADGTEKVIYSFTGSADGFLPLAGLITDRKGASKRLYGTTKGGGHAGVVFLVRP